MAVMKLKVFYPDREETVIVTPRAQVRTEERFSGVTSEATALRVMYHLAWASLQLAGKEPDDFDKWLDKIVDVEDVDDLVISYKLTGDKAEDMAALEDLVTKKLDKLADPTPGGTPPPEPSSPSVP